MTPSQTPAGDVHRGFLTTRWTAIARCAQEDDLAFAARSDLCRTYWGPVNSHLRRNGFNGHDAEDLTQGFFEHILSRPWFAKADNSRGRFRNFLLSSLQNFVKDVYSKQAADRRGGAISHESLEAHLTLDAPWMVALSEEDEVVNFDAEWTVAVIDAALTRLKDGYEARGKSARFVELRSFLSKVGSGEAYVVSAERLKLSISAVKAEVFNMRKEYGEAIRLEVARTVSTAAEIDDELRLVKRALSANFFVDR